MCELIKFPETSDRNEIWHVETDCDRQLSATGLIAVNHPSEPGSRLREQGEISVANNVLLECLSPRYCCPGNHRSLLCVASGASDLGQRLV